MTTGPTFERRGARRFRVSLRVKLCFPGEEGTSTPKLEIRDVSQRGFYFFSEVKRELASRFHFSILLRKPSGEEADLLKGTGQIVRCEDISPSRAHHFGIAAKIEDTTYEIGDHLEGLDHSSG